MSLCLHSLDNGSFTAHLPEALYPELYPTWQKTLDFMYEIGMMYAEVDGNLLMEFAQSNLKVVRIDHD